MKILCATSGKGGVGKTMTAVNLAKALDALGHRVGLLDLDITGANAMRLLVGKEDYAKYVTHEYKSLPVANVDDIVVMSQCLMKSSDGDAVAMRGEDRRALVKQFVAAMSKENLQYLVCDMPPATGDEIMPLYTDFHDMIKGAVIVTTPSDVAVLDVRKALVYCAKKEVKVLGLVVNQAAFTCQCGKVHDIFGDGEAVKKMIADFKLRHVYNIPIDARLDETPLYRNAELYVPIAKDLIKWRLLN
jgi:ATP-binding protein involved in chromosome partitioning